MHIKLGNGVSPPADDTDLLERRVQGGRSLVTGASGCVGSAIVRRLLDQGRGVNALVKDVHKLRSVLGSYSEHSELRVIEGNLDNIESLRRSAVGIDSVFHAAAQVHSQPRTRAEENEFFRVNVEGTRNLILAAKEQSLQAFVLFSTVAVYGSDQTGTLTENTPVRPDTIYARSKYEAELIVTETLPRQGVRPLILRLPLVYGSGDRGNFLRMVRAIDQRRFVLIDGGTARKSIIFSSDAAAAAIRAAFLGTVAGETFLIADPVPYEIRHLAECISQELGKRFLPFSISSRLAEATLEIVNKSAGLLRPDFKHASKLRVLVTDRICDVSKMKSLLGFVPAVGLKTGIKKTIEWYREFP